MKVSFDFDSTLDRNDVQQFAKELIADEHEVWIITSRHSDESAKSKSWWWVLNQNKNLFDVANKCGIREEHIHFTNGVDKVNFIKGKGFAFHLDDDIDELILILDNSDPCVPLHVDHFEWKENCLEVLNKQSR